MTSHTSYRLQITRLARMHLFASLRRSADAETEFVC